MTSPLVSVITLNWNRREDTIECLEALNYLTYPNARLLVVDNNSTDGSPAAKAKRFPHVGQLINPRNLGSLVDSMLGSAGHWKVALNLPLDYAGFDPSSLSVFRKRLLQHGQERYTFDRFIQIGRAAGFIPDKVTLLIDTRGEVIPPIPWR
ncbi:MAG TPA: glycosyltransferase [bacterium]|nr:glycosyltransferase [bacterium]